MKITMKKTALALMMSGVLIANNANAACCGEATAAAGVVATAIGTMTTTIVSQLYLLGMAVSGVKGAVDADRAALELQIKQDTMNVGLADQRNRLKSIDEMSANNMVKAMPTIQVCAELTKLSANSSGFQNTIRVGGSSKGKVGDKPFQVTSDAKAAENVLVDRKTLGTCTKSDVGGEIASCLNASPGQYPDGDADAVSLVGNIKTSDKKDPKQLVANYTIDAEIGKQVVEKYITNVTNPFPPPVMEKSQNQKAPMYFALYKAFMARVKTAEESLIHIVSWKIENKSFSSTPLGKFWTEESGKYESLTGFKAPNNPSEFEMLHYAVFKDYADAYGKAPQMLGESGDALTRKLIMQNSLNNYIKMTRIKQNEDTNAMLAALVSQEMNPVSLKAMESERIKASTIKAK